MKKALFLLYGILAVLLFASFGSAYMYGGNFNGHMYGPNYGGYGYGNDYYDSNSYHSTRTSGYNGFLTTRTTDYDKVTNTDYLPNGGYITRTTYTKTTSDIPRYGYGCYSCGYGGYNDNYWYRKYWDQPNYYYGRNPHYNYGYY